MGPRYPVYIPSKSRSDSALTIKCLQKDGVPFRVVVEPQEAKEYASRFGVESVLVLPFSNLGKGSIPARNWIRDHAEAEGHERHWQLDDNIRMFRRWYLGKRIPCNASVALSIVEDFVDRYENVGIAGLNYSMFAVPIYGKGVPAFYLNKHVYSCALICHAMPCRWRGRYNEDTDLCLQALSAGWCTVNVNAFTIDKMWTMSMSGGNTDRLYAGDGRLRMARALERMWPGVVTTRRRFNRPQHVIFDGWKRFDVPLRLKPGVKIGTGVNEYGMTLTQVKDAVKSDDLRELREAYNAKRTHDSGRSARPGSSEGSPTIKGRAKVGQGGRGGRRRARV